MSRSLGAVVVLLSLTCIAMLGGAGEDCPEDIVAPRGVEWQDVVAILNRWLDPACEPGGWAYRCPEDVYDANPPPPQIPYFGVDQSDLNAVLNRWGDPDCE